LCPSLRHGQRHREHRRMNVIQRRARPPMGVTLPPHPRRRDGVARHGYVPARLSPAVRRFAQPKRLHELRDRSACRQYRLRLTQLVHDLFRRLRCPLHLRESPGPSRGPTGLSWLVDQDLGGRSNKQPAPTRAPPINVIINRRVSMLNLPIIFRVAHCP
jgi:hypothetical protein